MQQQQKQGEKKQTEQTTLCKPIRDDMCVIITLEI